MMKRVQNFLRLRKGDRALFLISWLLLNGIRIGLWLLPFKVLQARLHQLGERIFHPSSQATLGRLVRAVNLGSRYSPGKVKCLARALAIQVLMTWYSYDSNLRIGVAKPTHGGLEAHAWVEHQGKVVMGYLPDLARYYPLSSTPR